MPSPLRVALLGLGTVGTGIINVLKRNQSEIATRAGRPIQVTHVLIQDEKKPRSSDLSHLTLTTDPTHILTKPEIDVVVEVMGGVEPARTYILQAMQSGKSIITANKALLALHGDELSRIAQQYGVSLAFEAAVAGGIPIIKILQEGLSANRIQRLIGIINGTGNYILSAMTSQRKSFQHALSEAQQLGYAEADPHLDVSGKDTSHKLTILATLAFGIPLSLDQVFVAGIERISAEDISIASEFGFVIKHLGIAYNTPQGIELRVHPTLIPEDHLLAHINHVTNAIMINGDAVGPMLFQGAGAGSEPTASAVIADLIDLAKSSSTISATLALDPKRIQQKPLKKIQDIHCAWYLRLVVADEPGVFADITRFLADQFISIDTLTQKQTPKDQAMIIIFTHQTRAELMENALKQINALPQLIEPATALRIEYL